MTESELRELLTRICHAAELPFEAYVLGGGALVLAGIQAETKDADLIVGDEASLHGFVGACRALGYQLVEEPRPAGLAGVSDKPATLLRGRDIVDVFQRRTTHFVLTDTIRGRARPVAAGRGTIAAVAPQDVFVLRSATGRAADAAAAARILAAVEIDWAALMAEVVGQQASTCRAAHDVLAMCHEGELWPMLPAWVCRELNDLARRSLDRITAPVPAGGGTDGGGGDR